MAICRGVITSKAESCKMKTISMLKVKGLHNLLISAFMSYYINDAHPIVTANDFGDPFTKPD